jgi:hypothetical protein
MQRELGQTLQRQDHLQSKKSEGSKEEVKRSED